MIFEVDKREADAIISVLMDRARVLDEQTRTEAAAESLNNLVDKLISQKVRNLRG